MKYCLDFITCYTGTVESIGGYILEHSVYATAIPELIVREREASHFFRQILAPALQWLDNVKI